MLLEKSTAFLIYNKEILSEWCHHKKSTHTTEANFDSERGQPSPCMNSQKYEFTKTQSASCNLSMTKYF